MSVTGSSSSRAVKGRPSLFGKIGRCDDRPAQHDLVDDVVEGPVLVVIEREGGTSVDIAPDLVALSVFRQGRLVARAVLRTTPRRDLRDQRGLRDGVRIPLVIRDLSLEAWAEDLHASAGVAHLDMEDELGKLRPDAFHSSLDERLDTPLARLPEIRSGRRVAPRVRERVSGLSTGGRSTRRTSDRP